jgi:DNA-binding transcriptional MerR regulator
VSSTTPTKRPPSTFQAQYQQKKHFDVLRERTMYTPSQISDILNIGKSTLRRYAQEYTEHLSEHASKKRRSYTEQDMHVLRIIRDEHKKRKSTEVIKRELPVLLAQAPEQTPDDTLSMIPTVQAEIESAQYQAREALQAVQGFASRYEHDITTRDEQHRETQEAQAAQSEALKALQAQANAQKAQMQTLRTLLFVVLGVLAVIMIILVIT